MDTIINSIIDLFSFIFEFLAKQTIYTAILFVIIFTITLFLKKRSSLWHYGLWALIFIRLLLPTDLSIPGSARSLVEQVPYMNEAVTSVDRIGSIENNKDVVIRHQPEMIPPEKTENAIYSDTAESEKNRLPVLIILLSSLWIAGCLGMAFVILKKSFRFHKIIKNSSEVNDDKLTTFLADWQEVLNISRKVCIVSSDEFLSPFTIGIIKPVIYIPSELVNTASADTLHSIIAHEMVHIKRLDALWINILNVLHIIYFFNPIVWFAGRKLSRAREEICDSVVLQYGKISGSEYGKGMLNVLSFNLFGADLLELSPGFGDQKKNYEHRIKNIIKEKIMSKNKKIAVICVICLLGLFLIPLGSKYILTEKKDEVVFENRKNTDEIEFKFPMEGGYIVSLFGSRKSPLASSVREFHTGIDIMAKKGTPVYAAAPGVVTGAGWAGGYGYLVKIKHEDGLESLYGHCEKILVELGQAVKSGDMIARCGETGSVTDTHLHLEIRKDGEPVEPYKYFRRTEPLQSPPAGNENIISGKNKKSKTTNEVELLLPMKGHITALFGWQKDPFGSGDRFHIGVDIGARHGTSIKAAASGVVKHAGWGLGDERAYGYTILIDHENGYSTVYAHCSKILVKSGQTVKAGDMIARCGATGKATGNHLHYEVRINGEPVNPYPYISSSINSRSQRLSNKDNYITSINDEQTTINNKIKFKLPIKGHVTALFGWGKHPLGTGKRFHTGIDIAAPNGTPIKAAASGIVRKAGWDGSQGYSVLIEHSSDYSTFYSHCHKVLVKEGQDLKSGDVIAKCGETGTSTGNHLHFEIRNNGEPINPYPYIYPNSI